MGDRDDGLIFRSSTAFHSRSMRQKNIFWYRDKLLDHFGDDDPPSLTEYSMRRRRLHCSETLGERDALSLLEACVLATAPPGVVGNCVEAVATADSPGYPVVLKSARSLCPVRAEYLSNLWITGALPWLHLVSKRPDSCCGRCKLPGYWAAPAVGRGAGSTWPRRCFRSFHTSAFQLRDEVAEIDLNPVIVIPDDCVIVGELLAAKEDD